MTSERTADADAAIVHLGLGLPGRSYRKITKDDAIAALDRLVARNQQLQEALDRIASGDINWQACKAEARAALVSVRARTPA